MKLLSPRTAYSRAEYLSDTIVHVSGLVIVLICVPILITLAAVWRGDTPALVGTTVYGLSLVAMILCSALYNIIGTGRWAWLLQRLDHSAIYAKIAGTYTPFVLLSGQNGWLIVGMWAAAFVGMGLKIASPHALPLGRPRTLSRHGLGGPCRRRAIPRCPLNLRS
jgi:hemolysin III